MEKEILKHIKDGLNELGISKRALAKELGCSVRLVHYWFKGERSISISMADKALKLLGKSYTIGVSPNELLGFSKESEMS